MEQQITGQRSCTQIYLDFAGELSECQNGGSLPQSGTQDSRFYLELQRKKLDSMGVTVRDRLIDDGLLTDVHEVKKEDAKYVSHMLYRDYKKRTEYYLNGKKKYKYSDSIVLYQDVLDIKAGNIPPQETVNCPHCGAPSTIGRLQNGCEYCNTRFMMTDLYPKCAGHYFLRNYSMTPKDGRKKIALFMLAGAALYTLWHFKVGGAAYNIGELLGSILAGGIFGFIAFDAWIMLKLFAGLFTSIPVMAKSGGRKSMTSFMQQFDPNFSFDHFTYKALALLKMMIFCDDKSDLAVYAGTEPAPDFDIVDAFYRGGMGIYNCQVSPDGYASVTAEIFMKDIHCSGGRIYCRDDTFRIGLRKSIRRPTELGFSYKAVRCPVCGQSFDATRLNRCPACGENYKLEDDDWVVTFIQKV